ncbi:hypothetical protein H8B09_27510 [Paenibacillus sp. PR3]|uniref:Uncharacterized protein n=1 Tax=Paenibacillus terricola TaxID=2763503 RepID=A0ABR8N4R2_9BACL|nr:hypothetical protein [Paenibacillus terricola]MBD3922531.1 hypothetical protein [Paenibacillus terricola]
MQRTTASKFPRRFTSITTGFDINQIWTRNPWVVAWWSAAFPGFGHLLLGYYTKGFVLIAWELFINTKVNLNEAMVFSFNGKFDAAKEALVPRWLLLYIPIYCYAIWDSYGKTIELNKHCLLAQSEPEPIKLFSMKGIGIALLDKRSPRRALIWSLIFPGLGHLYLQRLPIGTFIAASCIGISYYSHLAEAVVLVIRGSLEQARAVVDPEWFSFFPSMYCFAAYAAYVMAVEMNELYDREQCQYFRTDVQPPDYQLL